MASFSDTIKAKVQSMSVAQQKQAIKSANNTFKKGTPEYAQYKAEIAQYEVDANSFFNTQRDTIAREAVFKKSELDSQKEYSATIGDRAKAFLDTAYLSSDVAKAITRFAIENIYSDGTEDKDFMSTNNIGSISNALASNGISQSEYAYELLQNAKNQRDFDFYIQTLRTDEKMKESAAYLTPFRAGLASVEGAVLTDPTMLAYAPARLAIAGKEIYSFQQLQGGRRLATTVGTNAALQGSLSLMREYGSPERTATDLALDIAFGGVIDGYFTMKQLGRLDKLPTGNIADDVVDVNDFARMHEDARTINRGLTQFGNKAYDLSRSDLTAYKWSAGVEAAVKAEIDAVTPTTTELTGLNAIRADVETFTPTKETTETLLRTAGKTDEEITLAVQTAKQQEATLIAQVKATAKMDEATKAQEIAKVREKLKEIGKQSPEVEAKVMKEISKAIGKAPAPTKGKTATKVETAKQSYDNRSKQIAKVIENKKAKETKAKKAKKSKQAKAQKTQQPKEEFSPEVKALETEQGVFHRIASVVDEIVDEAKTTIDDIVTDGLPTKAEKDTFAQELSDDLTDILGQEVKVEVKPDEGVIVKGKLKFSVNGDTANINGNFIKVGTLMALGGSSVAMADSGDSVEFFNPFFVVIALAAGVYSTRAIRNAGGLKHVLKSTWEKVDSTDKIGRIMEKPMFKSWEAFRQTSVDKANFEIVNSMQVIMNNGSEMSKKIGQRLGFDAVNPQQVLNAMQSKMIMVREWVKTFTKTEDINYRAWLKENSLNESLWDEVLEGGAETKYREMFLQQCTDYVEFGKYADSPAVVAQANVGIGIFDDARQTGIINKIIGFSEKLTPSNPNYIPRMALNDAIMSIVANGGKEALSAQFVKAMRKALEAEGKTVDELGRTLNKKGEVVNKQTLQELADNMIDWYSDVGGKYANKSKAEAVIKAMKRLGYDTEGIDADLLIAESKTNSDAISRGKFRIPMDFSEFEPFKITIDGVEQTVTLGTIFERNMNSLVKAYSDQVGGAVALRRSTQGLIEGMDEGVTSESALRELIDKNEPNPDVREVLHTYVSVVAGKPLYESTRSASRIVDALRDYAYSRLALTQFAMVSEYATALTNMMMSKPAMEQGLTHLRNIVRRAMGGESVNTAMAETAQRLTGYGSSSLRRENTLKNIDNVFNMAANSDGNTIEKVGLMVKYLTLRMTNILHADDAMKTISTIAQTDYLNKWLRGEITISKNRLERFGINDKFVQMFKGGFKSDAEGNLLADYDAGWTQAMKDEYARVVNKMVMVDSPEAIASTLPHVALTSDAGRLVSFMTHFTATSYTTKFLQGVKRPDLKSYADTMIYFMGTYVGVYARHLATEQEEPDPKEVLYKSIMMMPMTAPYGIYSMVTDPMTTSMPNDIITEMSKLQDIIE